MLREQMEDRCGLFAISNTFRPNAVIEVILRTYRRHKTVILVELLGMVPEPDQVFPEHSPNVDRTPRQ
jgi:tRNA (Thr-GGU) A37 N-methylase